MAHSDKSFYPEKIRALNLAITVTITTFNAINARECLISTLVHQILPCSPPKDFEWKIMISLCTAAAKIVDQFPETPLVSAALSNNKPKAKTAKEASA